MRSLTQINAKVKFMHTECDGLLATETLVSDKYKFSITLIFV